MARTIGERVLAIEYKLHGLETEIAALRRTLSDLEPAVDSMVNEREIAKAVGHALQRQESRGWTDRERKIAVLGAVGVAVSLGLNMLQSVLLVSHHLG